MPDTGPPLRGTFRQPLNPLGVNPEVIPTFRIVEFSSTWTYKSRCNGSRIHRVGIRLKIFKHGFTARADSRTVLVQYCSDKAFPVTKMVLHRGSVSNSSLANDFTQTDDIKTLFGKQPLTNGY